VIFHCPVHGPEDPVGYVGRSGDKEKVAAGHGGTLGSRVLRKPTTDRGRGGAPRP
jgi:hypothetical protein